MALGAGALERGSDKPGLVVHFTGITDASGTTYPHNSGREKKCVVQSMMGSVALIDYDNDGCLDIYFTNSLTVDTATDPHSVRSGAR